ncbi:hypothetical protein T439DRAFT_380638 [Meredithblackwellia eburnea MCA 4105]
METIKDFLTDDLDLPHADLIQLIFSFATAIVDAFTFLRLGGFAANMTGNSVFLGLSIAQLHDPTIHADRSIVALCLFWLGAFVTGQIGHHVIPNPKRRYWLLITFFLQSLLIFISAILLYTHTHSFVDTQANLGLLTLLAFAFGSQAAVSRPLASTPITTVVVTSAMFDLWSDKNLFAKLSANKARNQRVAFIVTFFVGGIIGALCLRHVDDAFTVLLAGIIKMVPVGIILLAKGKHAEVKKGKGAPLQETPPPPPPPPVSETPVEEPAMRRDANISDAAV